MIGKIIGKVFGSDKLVGEIANFVDELNLTDQEKLEAKAKAQERFTNQIMASDADQNATNREEIKKGGFHGSWRPGIGWVCCISLGICFAGGFIFTGIVSTLMITDPSQVDVYKAAGDYFKENTEWVLQHVEALLIPILGIGLYRTIEKFGGVHNKH